jgi:ferredoxin
VKTLSLKPINRRPEVHTNDRILDALLSEKIDVLMACGGKGRCATCHVYVERGEASLTPIEAREARTLQRLSNIGQGSRLSCQARVIGEGVEVRLPEGLYVLELGDIEALVGTRADQNILHPITGKVIIPRGKIITRTFIQMVAELDSDVAKIRASDVYEEK